MRKYKIIYALSIVLILQGCANNNEKKFNDYLQKGLDSLIAEEYTKAEVYFEKAIEIDRDNKKAQDLLLQTVNMENALYFYDNRKDDEALDSLLVVMEIKEGSHGLLSKAESLERTIHKRNITFDDFKGNYVQFESTPYFFQ